MGVKNLWLILSPICERKSLWELQGKAVAIDLSCWVCDSQNVQNIVQPRMYLRNLFFRTSCLLLLGVKPVFVLEGKAPVLKHDVLLQRSQQRYKNKKSSTSSEEENRIQSLNNVKKRNKGSRSWFNSIQKECEELLRIMGVPCIQSAGEAEALCAQLNQSGIVDGCITQDGDCFLYGARTVFRNFTISNHGATGYSVEVYNMSVIEEKLSLSRQKLIALSLLCGCDYNDKGVLGIGKETALKFMQQLQDDEVLERLKQWRTDDYYKHLENEFESLANTCNKCSHPGKLQKHNKSGCLECGLLKGCIEDTEKNHLIQKDPEERKQIIAELSMRNKALQDENFPSKAIVNEFLQEQLLPDLNLGWKFPDLPRFAKFAVKHLNWTEPYAVEKFVPLVTRQQLMLLQNAEREPEMLSLPFCPTVIIKKRIQRGIQCFEVNWKDSVGVLHDVEHSEKILTTIEPQELVKAAYPDLILEYDAEMANTRKGKSKKKSKIKETAVLQSCACWCKENGDCDRKQNHLCKYFKTSGKTGMSREPRKPLEDRMINLDVKKNIRYGINKQTVTTYDILDTLDEHLEANSHVMVNKNEAVDNLQRSFQNLSVLDVNTNRILEEFNSLDVDDEISDISGIIEGIVGEACQST